MAIDRTNLGRSAPPANEPPCPRCGGIGFVRVDVPPEHPLFGRALPCICKQRELIERRARLLRQQGNIQHLGRMTFEAFEANDYSSAEVLYNLRDAKQTAQNFAAHPEGWLLITGDFGCGKTHLAAAIANERIRLGRQVYFEVVPDLLDHLRSTFAPDSPVSYSEHFDDIRNCELLILDDLGTQNATPWAMEKLYQIINYRYNAALPTVITTNQTPADMDPRLASRLLNQNLVHHLQIMARDRRIGGQDDTFGSLRQYAHFTLERFELRSGEVNGAATAALATARDAASIFAANPTNWMLLRGGYGAGKTHLAAAIANRVAQGGLPVKLVVVADLLDYLRATFQPGSPASYDRRFKSLQRASLLVLDDLGAQNATPWAGEKLFQLLNHRYLGGLPTVFTISSDNWEGLDERLRSRLLDRNVCTLVDLNVPSYRQPSPAPRKTNRKFP
jgi:DNA replication protein DnaC